MASAGSVIDDANFDEKTADTAVFNLTNERLWKWLMLYVRLNTENKKNKATNFGIMY